jgi:curved DNA-binding protein CbpA
LTHYEVLGVAADATPAEVRAAFVALARRHHPDFFASSSPAVRADAEQRMRAINEAWSVLSDRERRARYDRSLGIATGPGADPGFRPTEPDDPSAPDPRDQPDVPYRRTTPQEERRTRLATLVPIALFACSVVLFALALVLSVTALFALSVLTFIASCVGFVVVPLLVLSRAARDEG